MKKVISFTAFAALILIFSACAGFTAEPTATPEPTAAPEKEQAPMAPPTPTEIVHEMVPVSLPDERENQASDHDSSKTASRKHPPGGDRFTFGEFERPFNAETMDVYFPYLDIVDTEVYEDDTWVYATMTLQDRDKNGGLPGEYYVEIDQDRDGRGDWLVGVSVKSPTSSEWSSQDVQVWHDSNNDIGGNTAFVGDDNSPASDGYEDLVYNGGQGKFKDAAFALVHDEDDHDLHFAINKNLFEGTPRLLIGMWAGSDLDPAKFDLHDYYTHEQAGAADPGFEFFYPIKSIAEMDNSCRIALGFEPTGSEPGLCPSAAPKGSPEVCSITSCPQGTRFNQKNCSCDAVIIN